MRLHEAVRNPPPQQTRNRICNAVVFGALLPVGLLLLLQTTRFSVFPGRANILWAFFKVGALGILLLNSFWQLMDRRRKQRDTR